jgi:hypothetical protein
MDTVNHFYEEGVGRALAAASNGYTVHAAF